VSEASTAAERESAMARFDVDHGTLSRYRQVVSQRGSKEKKEREPLTARRLTGGGRKKVLTDEQEKELEEWIMQKREGPDKERVTERAVKVHARLQYHIQASNKWMAGFMGRRRLSMRLRTTTKEVTSANIQSIAQRYRDKMAVVFAKHPHALL